MAENDTQTTPPPEAQTPVPAEAPAGNPTPTVAEIMAFDPFAPENEAKLNGEPESTGTDKTPGEGGNADEKPVSQPPKKEDPPQPKEDATAQLKAQLAEQAALVASLQKQLQQQQLSPTQQPQPQPTKPEPNSDLVGMYQMRLPTDLRAALRSEDEGTFEQGIAVLMQSQAIAIHRNIRAEMAQMVQQVIPNLVQQTSRQQSESQRVEADFYGKYPQYNHPTLRPIVRDTAVRLAKEMGKTGWDEQLRDATAEHVTKLLASALPQAPAPAPAPPAKPVRQPYTPSPAPARVGNPTQNPNSPEDIGKTLGLV